MIVMGRSLGSLYAIHAASLHPDLAGLVLESGIADPVEVFGKHLDQEFLTEKKMDEAFPGLSEDLVKLEVEKFFDVTSKMKKYVKGKLLILHVKDDKIVTVKNAVQLYDASPLTPKSEKRITLFDHGSHNNVFINNYPEYLASMTEFLKACGHSKGKRYTGMMVCVGLALLVAVVAVVLPQVQV